jgi:hypothetical protein
VEGFGTPFETVDLLGVLDELNGPPLCQGHLPLAQPEAMMAKTITHAHRDKELRIIRESFAKGQERSPFVRRPPCQLPETAEFIHESGSASISHTAISFVLAGGI